MVVSTWRDLQRKYVRDKPAIHATWLSLSLAQRKELILSGADGGESGFLRHRDDAVGPRAPASITSRQY